MRAFFGLKRAVLRSKLSFKALTTLFDSLIKPIILYGAPIWAPNSTVWGIIAKEFDSNYTKNKNLLKKLSSSTQEKVHLSFLKWALGVHRKASNIGVWGESGRLPLVYESIRLSINYMKRIENLENTSLVSAALREQKKLNLPWYARMKAILKIDEIYSNDHVTAYHALYPKSKLIKPNRIEIPHVLLSHVEKLNPVKSEKCRTWKIIEALTENFKLSWQHQKFTSPKLTFYHKVKSTFGLEPYLACKNFKNRSNTTQLRISAHKLQIERGRYINLPREKRTCLWCQTTLGQDYIEDESHFLFNCDLYQGLRNKLIANLNKNPVDTQNIPSQFIDMNLNITSSNIQHSLMSLLSPNVDNNQNNPTVHPEHLPKNHSQELDLMHSKRAYLISCICSYVSSCFKERKNLTESARASRLTKDSILVRTHNALASF